LFSPIVLAIIKSQAEIEHYSLYKFFKWWIRQLSYKDILVFLDDILNEIADSDIAVSVMGGHGTPNLQQKNICRHNSFATFFNAYPSTDAALNISTRYFIIPLPDYRSNRWLLTL
jgi:hypothetical protein